MEKRLHQRAVREGGVQPVMPCGYDRYGISLRDRLKHYRACPDPACKERLHAWETLRAEFAKDKR